MSCCRDIDAKTEMLNEIIDNASTLPIECQDLLLSIAKGMVFTKQCLLNQGYFLSQTSEDEQQEEKITT